MAVAASELSFQSFLPEKRHMICDRNKDGGDVFLLLHGGPTKISRIAKKKEEKIKTKLVKFSVLRCCSKYGSISHLKRVLQAA